MEKLIEAIRCAVADDASKEARANGAQACRTLLVALEANAGEWLAPASPSPTSALNAIVGALRTMPADQLLDLAIAKLTAALSQGATAPATAFVRFPIVPVGRIGGGA
jgi:hypothetical protein